MKLQFNERTAVGIFLFLFALSIDWHLAVVLVVVMLIGQSMIVAGK